MNNKTKTILLASLIVAMIIPLTAMIIPLTAMEIFATADKKEQGKTIINHMGVPLVHTPDWKERDNLMKQKETTTDEIEKRQIESKISILHSKIQVDLDSKYDESKYEIAMEKKRLLTDFVTENRQTMGYREAFMYLPTVAHGYDYTNNSLRVAIDHKYFNEPNLEIYEERIRSIVGHDVDITFHPGSVGRLDSCSSRTTGECEPIDGGVAFDSDDLLVCTVMFAATYNGNTGFVTAGHCVDGLGNHDVNQSPSSSKDLGNIEQETFVSGTTFDVIV